MLWSYCGTRAARASRSLCGSRWKRSDRIHHFSHSGTTGEEPIVLFDRHERASLVARFTTRPTARNKQGALAIAMLPRNRCASVAETNSKLICDLFQISVKFTWNLVQIHLESTWDLFKVYLESVWDLFRICLRSVWDLFRICLRSPWDLFGIFSTYLEKLTTWLLINDDL